jgi:hypothetical protein
MSASPLAGRRIIVVLGMHRSGTSAVARGLQAIGVDLGDRLEPPDEEDNAKGYFEDIDIVALNDDLLAEAGLDWASLDPLGDDVLAQLCRSANVQRAAALLRAKARGDRPFGFKDPRTAKLLAFWRIVFAQEGCDVRYVLAVRNPLSVVRSLARRDRFEPEFGFELWLEHAVACLCHLHQQPAVVVDYDRMMADPLRELARMAAVVGGEVDPQAAAAYAQEFLTTELRHSVAGAEDVAADRAAGPAVRDAALLLADLAGDRLAIDAGRVQASVDEWSRERLRLRPLLRAFDRVRRARSGLIHRLAAAEAAASAAAEENAANAASVAALARRCRDLESAFEEIRASFAWRATAPVRRSLDLLRATGRILRAAPEAVRIGGGWRNTLVTTIRVLWREGFRGVRARVLHAELAHPAATETSVRVRSILVEPVLARQPAVAAPAGRLAVHLHVEDVAALAACAPLLSGCADVPFLVSVAGTAEAEVAACRRALAHVQLRAVEPVGALGPLGAFVEHALPILAGADFLGHLRVDAAAGKGLAMLLGVEGAGVAPLLAKLAQGAPAVFVDRIGSALPQVDEADVIELLRRAGEAGIGVGADADPDAYGRVLVGFLLRPDTAACVSRLASALRVAAAGLPRPLASVEAALQAAFVRSVATPHRRALRLFEGDAVADHRHYEPQLDLSERLAGNDVMVFAYYLPQFHPIPENDAWHGKGFTEWTKVRAAAPLFVGHHQQRVPDEAVGYYLLDGTATLRRQAEDMRRAGVQAQVFYHYWFGGRLILEQPARTLLASPDVPMRFCFCWANENWTRRWDGNEREILLAQDYSHADAVAFIRYLIPFFKDPRHVTVDGRPLLFVYRPSSLPDARGYVAAWRQECEAAGVRPPFVVAVLTRGAVDPREYGMDAATERVLHDWTNGAVPERKGEVAAYAPIAGRIIDYDEVAAHYESSVPSAAFETYRSIVPSWDNTPRYGREAYVVRGSTPRRFQHWFEHLVRQARDQLPSGRRLILVNAWNEWAEGAHLEADARHGHAYLNSLGRALAGLPFQAAGTAPPPAGDARVHLVLAPCVVERARIDPRFRRAFVHAIGRSSLLGACQVAMAPEAAIDELAAALPVPGGDADLVLEVRRPCLFGRDALEALVARALREPGVAAVANACDAVRVADDVDADGRVADVAAATAALMARPANAAADRPMPVRLATEARCFPVGALACLAEPAPRVTTILRFHRRGDLRMLRNALGSLAAISGCTVTPLLALQDLDAAKTAAVKSVLAEFEWGEGVEPELHAFQSADGAGDLRSRMMNECLRRVRTRYAGFLDHDDLLFPHAYAWLTQRLVATGKAIAFGRVYRASYDRGRDLVLDRARVYEFGASHADFVDNNFAPIHSFLLDLSRLDVPKVRHFDDQRYMEDYYLMLQLVTRDNADWEGLAMNRYVGDYLHAVDGGQTLAIVDPGQRLRMLADPLYQRCERRINELRAGLR